MQLNSPEILAEIAALHDAYERALIANDVTALTASFWPSPDTIRFGVREHLYGADAIAAYRSDSPPSYVDRRILRRTITAFGSATASVMCELTQTVAGEPRHSRQSQLWIRFPDTGWKIVAAHVSHLPEPPPSVGAASAWSSYVDRAAAAVALPIDPAHRPGVVLHLQRAATLAGPLLEFELPADAELAPVFTP